MNVLDLAAKITAMAVDNQESEALEVAPSEAERYWRYVVKAKSIDGHGAGKDWFGNPAAVAELLDQTEVTVACLDAEFSIECIRRERGHVVIRIEPDGELL